MTYRIIGAAMKVHRQLGPGLLEASYQQALAMEFQSRGIPYRREAPVNVFYEGRPVGAARRSDFICYDCIVVELKAAAGGFHAVDLAQALHYMTAAKIHVGLLINFGQASLQFRRLLQGAELPSA